MNRRGFMAAVAAVAAASGFPSLFVAKPESLRDRMMRIGFFEQPVKVWGTLENQEYHTQVVSPDELWFGPNDTIAFIDDEGMIINLDAVDVLDINQIKVGRIDTITPLDEYLDQLEAA